MEDQTRVIVYLNVAKKVNPPSCCGISADANSECALNDKVDCQSEPAKCRWQQNSC
jgi:hypothetical protein